MKLSDLKFDGTDYYEDEHVIIDEYDIYISEILKNYLKNKIYLQYNSGIYHTHIEQRYQFVSVDVFLDSFYESKITLMKSIIQHYQIYLRKNKLNEII